MDALTSVTVCRGLTGYYARVTWAGMLVWTTRAYPAEGCAVFAARLWVAGGGWR